TYHVHSGGHYLPDGAQLWQLTDDATYASRSPVGSSIVCTLRLGISQLLARLPSRPRARAEGRSGVAAPAAADPLSSDYAWHSISRHAPKDAVLLEEAPSHRNALHEFFPVTASSGFYACASGGLGWALPAAVGVALGEPTRKVICVVGDGSSLYSIQGLWSAVREKLPIAFVILNNSGYGALKSFGRMLQIPGAPGHEVPGVDFVAVAQGFGCKAVRAATTRELDLALQHAFAANEPYLVDACLDDGEIKLY
ncbi:MAG: thiamine pyrophosphate-dependent enzyme, partial [Burkholderiales bacterium]